MATGNALDPEVARVTREYVAMGYRVMSASDQGVSMAKSDRDDLVSGLILGWIYLLRPRGKRRVLITPTADGHPSIQHLASDQGRTRFLGIYLSIWILLVPLVVLLGASLAGMINR
jgi:hypothetical protein